MKNRIRNNRGFTLVELLIVMVLLGVIAGIMGYGFNNVNKDYYEKNIRSAFFGCKTIIFSSNRADGIECIYDSFDPKNKVSTLELTKVIYYDSKKNILKLEKDKEYLVNNGSIIEKDSDGNPKKIVFLPF